MSFLELTLQQKTGIAVQAWLDWMRGGIQSAKANYDNIVNWLVTIEGNPDFTEEDKTVVLQKVGEILSEWKALIPNTVE